MIYKSSLNHKGNRATFKDLFGSEIDNPRETSPDLFSTLVMWFLNHDPFEVIQPWYIINV
jgi:hypothetical protein